ncbi:MAG: transcription termination factor Rho [Planctomycetota bacterium]|nr:transcription termination factor Rho [Planctomycetota bacterium]
MAKQQQKQRYKHKQKYKQQHQQTQARASGAVAVDFATLPADMSLEQIEELVEALPKLKRKTLPKSVDHCLVQALNLAEMHELAEKEKVGELTGKKRRDIIWEITTARLTKHIPVEVEGTLDTIKEGHSFLRSRFNDYVPSADDIYIPASLVTRYGLLPGMTVRGFLRPAAEGEKYFAVHQITLVDGGDPEEAGQRAPFSELIPIYPIDRILLEGTDENPLEILIFDLITPIGRGQRGLIVAPPRTGKTVLLQMLAKSVAKNAPDAHLIILLIDERPEEVTDFQRQLPEGAAEVVSSTFDEPATRHIEVAKRVIEKARSMVEAGSDVVILLDSITRLARACNVEAPSNGKLLSGGIEATALQFPKQFFGAARKIENGGSLTILGSALIETGSKMDEVIFEEFKGTGNMELVLERRLSDRRIYPAIDINRSGTRKEELLFTEEEIERVWMLRKVLNELDPVEAMEMLIQKMRKTRVNGEFLMSIGG